MNVSKLVLLMLSLGVALLGWPGHAEPVVAKSLVQLDKSANGPEAFEFIVTGDSEVNRMPPVQSPVFLQMLREFNLLKPAFVIEVGDLVLGGSADKVPGQWDDFQNAIGQCQVPFMPVPGNHDISDAATEKLWLERMGPTRYAFTYGNSRFIVLDSEEVDALDRLSDEQVAWFKNELETTKAANIFVFLHQPYFVYEEGPDKAEEAWAKRWKYLADVMHGHPVRAVFAGHIHGYMDCGVRDGVHYVIAGGAASFPKDGEPHGAFNHYLLVRVRGDEVSWSVIKPGAVLPPDAYTEKRHQEVYTIGQRLVTCDEITLAPGESVDRDVTVRVDNPFDKPFDGTLAWEVTKGWKVAPAERAYSAPAKGGVNLTFHVSADSPEAARFPVPSYGTCYANTQYGPPVKTSGDLPLVPLASASCARKPVRVDAVLDEWKAIPPIPLSYQEGSFKTPVADPADLSGQMRVMWDKKNLYFAFDITDNEHCQDYAGDIVWLGDAIELGIDKWAWALSLTKNGPEVFSYIGEGTSAETVNKNVKLAARRDGTHTIYEVAIPARYVEPLALKAGGSFALRANICDRDNSGAQHGMGLTPGGDDAPRVRMTLQKAKGKTKKER